jgi:phage tail sheath protein FI
MANSNRVFVSPGIYTSEKDLTFVAQSVGVTTLGLIGETLKGPAFEPVLISNFDEFRTYFGNTSPVKDGNGNPKYELPYVAKSYLQESNQLFVTRVLGLTGYRPNISFGIKTLGGVTVDLGSISPTSGITYTTSSSSGSTIYGDISGITSFNGITLTNFVDSQYDNLSIGKWFVIGKVDANDVALLTVSDEVSSPLTGLLNDVSIHGKEWYNVLYDGVDVRSYLFVSTGPGTFDVTEYTYNATVNSDNDDVVIAVLRSRGSYSGQTLVYEVNETSGVTISNVDILEDNPFGEFTLNVEASTGTKTFTCSMDPSSSKFITKVLGTEVFDKNKNDFPVYVHEIYNKHLKSSFDSGLVRGLSLVVAVENDQSNFVEKWQTSLSPMVVSEVRGGNVSDLFEVTTISDGDSSNYQVKIMVQNVNIENGEFDILVRDFNDSDDSIVILERYSRCTMNPELPGYVGRKIGTSDGEYELRSKFIMLIMAENHPTNAFPAGFRGFVNNTSFGTSTLGGATYKTKYYEAGDVVGYEANGSPILTNGDKIRKVSLGVSSQVGFDRNLLKFKGLGAIGATKGFHLSSNASSISGFTSTEYDLEGQTGDDDTNKMRNISNRKFTFVVAGGFDGWDTYREVRTNGDAFIFGKSTYISGNTSNTGVFDPNVGNSDYYAYLDAINTFGNPEAIDINLFSTPGLDWFNHGSLVSQAIEMIEDERADSLYIINSPGPEYFTSADGVSEELDNVGLDSNYSATYWPWIQIRDTDNSTQLYIPPTGEVLKNIALTDNVSYPWFAVAGYSRGLVSSIKASKKLTLDERDQLYKSRINPIATFSDTGTIIWGNKTLQVRESALDRINVRRLLLRARKLISAVAVRLLFEQNDEQVRNEFLRLVNPILETIKKERGLNDFRVVVSNDPEDFDANTLRGKIYIKPTRSLEFIDVEFVITPTGASFENI